MRILFENNKTCSYEIEDQPEDQPDYAERDYQKQNIYEEIGEW